MKVRLTETQLKRIIKESVKKVINEKTNAERLLKRHKAYLILSACRDENTEEENKINTQDLLNQIKAKGYSYKRTTGGAVENCGKEDEKTTFEDSFMVFAFKNDGTPVKIAELKEFGREMCEEFNQSEFVFKEEGKPVIYLDRNGEDSFSPGDDVVFNYFEQDFFTDLHRSRRTHGMEGDDLRRPSRFTFREK